MKAQRVLRGSTLLCANSKVTSPFTALATFTWRRHASTSSTAAYRSPRWLSDAKSRIGYCLMWGLKSQQIQEAGSILQEMARDWRELVAGSEGYLTSKYRRSTFRQQVVWGEQDVMGHVNNVVYNRYAETGRVDWFRKLATYTDPEHAREWREMLTPTGEGLILRKITMEFKFPMKYPDHVTILHKLKSEPVDGADAFDMEVLILSELHQRPAARAFEDCVFYDYRKGQKIPFHPFMLKVLQHTWSLQEGAKRVNSQRVSQMLERIRKLEKDSWDKEGAVEDMGSASA